MERCGITETWRTCPICGKRFSMFYPALWAYRRRIKTTNKALCSWSCCCAFDKTKKNKPLEVESFRPRKKRESRPMKRFTADEVNHINDLIGEGLSLSEVSKITGRSYSSLYIKFVYNARDSA
jgi:hypothetical protein